MVNIAYLLLQVKVISAKKRTSWEKEVLCRLKKRASDEFEFAEKLRQVEVEFADNGTPGQPVVVTFHAAALVEVCAPDITGFEFQTGEVFLKQSQRNLNTQTPFDGISDAFDLTRKGMVDAQLFEVFFGKRREFCNFVVYRVTVPVLNEIGEDGAAAVDFKVDVFFSGRLNEKFNAAVKADIGIVFRFDAADILIVNFIQQIEIVVIIAELGDGFGTVSGTFGHHMIDFNNGKIFPAAIVKTAGKINRTIHPADIVFHRKRILIFYFCPQKNWQPRQDSNLN